jgi:hypothetical protein
MPFALCKKTNVCRLVRLTKNEINKVFGEHNSQSGSGEEASLHGSLGFITQNSEGNGSESEVDSESVSITSDAQFSDGEAIDVNPAIPPTGLPNCEEEAAFSRALNEDC